MTETKQKERPFHERKTMAPLRGGQRYFQISSKEKNTDLIGKFDVCVSIFDQY